MGETIFIFALIIAAIVLLAYQSTKIKPNKTYDEVQNELELERLKEQESAVKKLPKFYKILVALTIVCIIVNIYWYFIVNYYFKPIPGENVTTLAYFFFTIPVILLWIIYYVIKDWNGTSEKKLKPTPNNDTSIIKPNNSDIRSEARKRLREAKSDFEEGFLTQEEYQKILDENKPKIL